VEDNKEACNTCDGTGWFYGDADLSWCGCGIQPFYGYWLYHECDCGGILTSWAQFEQLHASDPLVERVSWARYKQAYEDGWDVEWTENEEL